MEKVVFQGKAFRHIMNQKTVLQKSVPQETISQENVVQETVGQETVFQEIAFQETVFHVHTFRCKHAENVPDEAYVKRALELQAGDIWFTDHAPFPGNPFGLRMAYEELPEYLNTLTALREKYAGQIRIHIGLEIEYFEQFADYYRELYEEPRIELLLLGQHMAAVAPDQYSFSLPKEELDEKEAEYLVRALIQGMNTGYFQVCAHPDRSFRRKKEWTAELEELSKKLIHVAQSNHVTLEHNLSSMRNLHQYWEEFWALVPE
ncbi:MAG: PHP domain-containing protein [Lachnospiraceae bacterium]|nr:PHP domain-containing protein [Lachnospiraceae bacterium]